MKKILLFFVLLSSSPILYSSASTTNYVPIMLDGITIIIPISSDSTNPPDESTSPTPIESVQLPEEGITPPEKIDICTNSKVVQGVKFACQFLTYSLWVNAGQPRIFGAAGEFGQQLWTPSFTFNGNLDYFESIDYSQTNSTGAPGVKVKRYVPWSSGVVKASCDSWDTQYQQLICLYDTVDRKEIVSFGSTSYESDASDPTDNYLESTLLEILYVASQLEVDGNFLRIENSSEVGSPVTVRRKVDWQQYGRFDIIYPNIATTYKLAEINQNTIKAGSHVMLPGSNVSYLDHLDRAKQLANETGKQVYAVYLGQNFCYLDDCNPIAYDEQQVLDSLDSLLLELDSNNLVTGDISLVIGKSYTAERVQSVAKDYSTFEIKLFAPAMPFDRQQNFYEYLRQSQSHVEIIHGNSDVVCAVFGGCFYTESYMSGSIVVDWGAPELNTIYNDPNYIVDPFIINDVPHNMQEIQDFYPW